MNEHSVNNYLKEIFNLGLLPYVKKEINPWVTALHPARSFGLLAKKVPELFPDKKTSSALPDDALVLFKFQLKQVFSEEILDASAVWRQHTDQNTCRRSSGAVYVRCCEDFCVPPHQ